MVEVDELPTPEEDLVRQVLEEKITQVYASHPFACWLILSPLDLGWSADIVRKDTLKPLESEESDHCSLTKEGWIDFPLRKKK